MAFRVRESKMPLRSDHLGGNRYVLTGPVSHGPGWRLPPVRVVGPPSFGHPFDGHRDPSEDKSRYLVRSSQPGHLWAGQQQQQPGSLRGIPQPGSLRGHQPPPSVQGGMKKSSSQPLRRAVSFLERDAVQLPTRQQTGKQSKQAAIPKFEEQEEVVYDAWAMDTKPTKEPAAKKMNRSKSFMDQSQAGEGKVRKMLRKSASILYPSWLATARRNSHAQQQQLGNQQQQAEQQLKKESLLSKQRPVGDESRHLQVTEVEDLDQQEETTVVALESDATVETTAAATTSAAAADDGWESMDKNDRLAGKSVGPDLATAAADVTGGPAPRRSTVQLPRLSERNRLVQQQQSPTVADHPAGSVLSSSSSSASSSTLPKNNSKTTSKWHISSAGPKSVATAATQVNSRKAPVMMSAERRWQSLIVLPDAGESKGTNDRGYPANGYGELENNKKKLSVGSGVMAYGGSASFLEIERDYATVSWEDLSDSHLYHHLHPIKALSQTSLATGQHQQQQRMTSCPSYESLDDYLITSDDESRRNYARKTSDSLNSQQLVYCDSFESLPRPPPPADADYSPPDISPDDSSETHRGGRVRLKLQRLPTFIQRQEAWQRKPWNQKQQQQQKVFSAMIPEASPEPGGHNWRSHSSQEEEEVDEEEEEDDLSRGPGHTTTTVGGGVSLIHHRAAVASARGAPGGGRGTKGVTSGSNAADPVYWHDWLPPPAALLDCGCGLCRITASMNGSNYQLRAPAALFAPPPPTRPPPPHVFPLAATQRQQQQAQQKQLQLNQVYQKQQQHLQQQLRQLPHIFGNKIHRDFSFHQQTAAKPPPPRKVHILF